MKAIIKTTWSEIRPRTHEEWVKFLKIAGKAVVLFGIIGAMLWISCALSGY